MTSVLVSVSLSVKRHHDYRNTKKTSNCGGFLIVAEAQSIVIMGDMAACRKA